MDFVLSDLVKGPKRLVNLLAKEKAVELTINLQAVAPKDFFDLVERCLNLREFGKEQLELELAGISPALMEQSRKLKIQPLTTIDCDFSSYWGPRIEHKYPYYAKNVSHGLDNLFAYCTHPLNVISWRPRTISLNNAREPRHLAIIRDTVRKLVPQQYCVRSLYAGFSPSDWESEYSGGTDCSVKFWLDQQGKVTVFGADNLPQCYTKHFIATPEILTPPIVTVTKR